MKKIRALYVAMALIAVVAFASSAFASTSLIVADYAGRVKLLTLKDDGTTETSK